MKFPFSKKYFPPQLGKIGLVVEYEAIYKDGRPVHIIPPS